MKHVRKIKTEGPKSKDKLTKKSKDFAARLSLQKNLEAELNCPEIRSL